MPNEKCPYWSDGKHLCTHPYEVLRMKEEYRYVRVKECACGCFIPANEGVLRAAAERNT